MTYTDDYNLRTTSVKFNDIADAIDGVITRQYGSTTTGTASAYIANPAPAWQSYDSSSIIVIIPHITNSAGATIQISPSTNGIAPKDLKIGGAAIGAGILQQGIPTVLAYTGVYFEVLLQNVSIPTGQVTSFAGATAPTGWLLCDGSEYSQTTYATLFGVIGSNYNLGTETAGYFRVPDLRRRFAVGVGGSDTLGNTEGGNKTGTAYASRSTSHNHTIAHSHSVSAHQHTVPAHYHTNTTNSLSVDISHTHQTSDITGSVGGSDGTHTHTVASGGSHSHDLRQEAGGGGTSVGSAANIISLVNATAAAYRNDNNFYTGGAHSHTVETTNSGHGHSFSLSANLGSTTKYVSGTVGTGVNGNAGFSTNAGEGAQTLTTTTAEVSGNMSSPFLFINYIIKI